MSGASDYAANAFGRWLTGQQPMPVLPAIWMGLFATVPSDANVGGVELNGNGYARAQIAGQAATSANTASGTVLTFASVPSWVAIGMSVFDASAEDAIVSGQTVAAIDTTANTVTLNAAIDASVVSGDLIAFSAFGAPAGSAPSVFVNIADVFFPVTTGPQGTASGFGFFDAASGGNLIDSDVLAGGAQVIGGPNFQPRFVAGQISIIIN
jgi:hypothetical protein